MVKLLNRIKDIHNARALAKKQSMMGVGKVIPGWPTAFLFANVQFLLRVAVKPNCL